MAKFDTVSEMDEEKIMIAAESSGSRFLTPIEQNNNTNGDASETNWDRLNLNGEKKQPAYVLYIAHTLENEQYKEDVKYIESVKAANQFGIPVVLIDRQRVIENEHLEIERLIEEYKTTKSIVTMKKVIQRFENNRTTCGYNSEFVEQYNNEFPLKGSEIPISLNSIIKLLVEYSKNDEGKYITENLQHMIDELIMQTIKGHGNKEKDFCEMVYDIKEIDPTLIVDVDKMFKRYLGITQKEGRPHKISKDFMKSFYCRRENISEIDSKKKFTTANIEDSLYGMTERMPISTVNDTSLNIRSDVTKGTVIDEWGIEEGWSQDDWN